MSKMSNGIESQGDVVVRGDLLGLNSVKQKRGNSPISPASKTQSKT